MIFFKPFIYGIKDNRKRTAEYKYYPKRTENKESKNKGNRQKAEEKILLYSFLLHSDIIAKPMSGRKYFFIRGCLFLKYRII